MTESHSDYREFPFDSSRKYYAEIVISSLNFVQSKYKSLNLQKYQEPQLTDQR